MDIATSIRQVVVCNIQRLGCYGNIKRQAVVSTFIMQVEVATSIWQVVVATSKGMLVHTLNSFHFIFCLNHRKMQHTLHLAFTCQSKKLFQFCVSLSLSLSLSLSIYLSIYLYLAFSLVFVSQFLSSLFTCFSLLSLITNSFNVFCLSSRSGLSYSHCFSLASFLLLLLHLS